VLPREARDRRRPPRAAAGSLTRLATVVLLAAALAAASCGEDGSTDDGGQEGEAATDLAVGVDPDGDGEEDALEATVTCPGDDEPVCAAVAAIPEDPGAPVDPATPCTEVYGGPDRLRVIGTLRGESIEAVFTRENGCEIERFDRFGELLRELFPEYTPGQSLAA
jgi:hypothetical protein